MKKRPWHRYLLFALFCAVIYFPLFHHLDWEPVHNWDESLFAMRAGYMAEEGKYLRDYSYWVEDGPRHRSTKPPFTTWIQALSMKTLGLNELALRLPIALTALGTVFLFLYFSKKELGDVRIGYCAGFVLVTTAGYVKAHAARTGDQDAALAFYMLAGAVAFFKYIEAASDRERWKWLGWLTLTLVASALTKYVFGLFFLPAFFIYAIYKKQLAAILKRGSTWLSAFVFAAAVGSWLAVIEWRLPGFVERAFFYEMLDRYATTIENHDQPWWYYFAEMWKVRFVPWLYLLPVPLVMLFSKKFRAYRDAILLMLLCALILLLIVAFSQTKTTHYEVVAYPPLAFLAGLGLYELLKSGWELGKEKKYLPLLAFFGFLYFLKPVLLEPYIKTLDEIFDPKLTQADLKYGYLFRQLESNRPGVKKFTVLHSGFDGQAIFYAGVFNRKKNYDISLSINPELVQPGDTVMACRKEIIKYLFEHWELQGIEAYDQCFLAAVVSEKKQATKESESTE